MWPGSGFITQIIYATASTAQDQGFEIQTENNDTIITEAGQPIEIEH
jgi:hypothetical protein